MRLGLYIPPFDELADPALVARLCAEAEEAGWDGAFIWDQLHWREPVAAVGDPQITLAAIAGATERIRLGPMVTPLARRRPAKVARETATLDRLSDGRLTLGVGLGSDKFAGEYSITGEELDDRKRAGMLDEALGILQAAWTGEPVHHRGEHYTIDTMRFLPRPVQRPGVPIWSRASTASPGHFAARSGTRASSRWASSTRTSSPRSPPSSSRLGRETSDDAAAPFDLAVELDPGSDPAPYAAAGATWGLVAFPWNPVSVDQVRGVIREGPP